MTRLSMRGVTDARCASVPRRCRYTRCMKLSLSYESLSMCCGAPILGRRSAPWRLNPANTLNTRGRKPGFLLYPCSSPCVVPNKASREYCPLRKRSFGAKTKRASNRFMHWTHQQLRQVADFVNLDLEDINDRVLVAALRAGE